MSVISSRFGPDQIAKVLDGLPWAIVWSMIAILTSWAVLVRRDTKARELQSVRVENTIAVLHVGNLFGLAAAAAAVRASLYIQSPFLHMLTLNAFLILFFQWLVSWSAIRSHSRSLTTAALTLVEGLMSGLLILGLLFAVGLLIDLWADATTHTTGTKELLFYVGQPRRLMPILVSFGITAGMLQAHTGSGGLLAPWLANLLPPILLILWLIILHLAGTSKVPSDILPVANPGTLVFRLLLVYGVPIFTVIAWIAGIILWQKASSSLHNLSPGDSVSSSAIKNLRTGQVMIFLAILLTLCEVILASAFLYNKAHLVRWLEYGGRVNSLRT